MSSRRRFLKLPPLALAAGAAARAADAMGQGVAPPAQPRSLEPPPPPPQPELSAGQRGPRVNAKYDTYIRNPLVERNEFLRMEPENVPVPAFDASRDLLPEPFWDGHASTIDCYWRAWQLAFSHLMRPEPASGFVANFIDPAFNDCVFMWDACFMVMFGRYGARAFPFVRTLDNLYAKQHPDGFICREIGRVDGADRFFRYDPDSTGPNVLGWTEWEHYRNFGDRERLARVFPVLRAYHQWLRAFRTWPDGSYFSSGWGCGMDNQPRLNRDLPYYNHAHSHGWMTWVDTTLQQVLSARLLVRMARELGAADDVSDVREEEERLSRFANAQLWDETAGFYFDRWNDGRLNGVKTIGAYWALLAGVVPRERLDRFVAHLDDPRTFNRPHRVPSLAADTPDTTRRAATGAAACGPTRTTWCCAASRRSAATGSRTRSRATTSATSSPSSRAPGRCGRTTRRSRPRPATPRGATSSARAACRRSACCSSTSSACGPTRRRGGSSGTCG